MEKTLNNLNPTERELVGYLQKMNETQLTAVRDLLRAIIPQGETSPAASNLTVRQIPLDL